MKFIMASIELWNLNISRNKLYFRILQLASFKNNISLVCFLRVWFSSKFRKMGLNGPISRKSLVKSPNQNISEKFKLNRNLRRIPFKMMYNMSMLHHPFSNERWWVGGGGGGGGGRGALNHLPLLFCRSEACQSCIKIFHILWNGVTEFQLATKNYQNSLPDWLGNNGFSIPWLPLYNLRYDGFWERPHL